MMKCKVCVCVWNGKLEPMIITMAHVCVSVCVFSCRWFKIPVPLLSELCCMVLLKVQPGVYEQTKTPRNQQ